MSRSGKGIREVIKDSKLGLSQSEVRPPSTNMAGNQSSLPYVNNGKLSFLSVISYCSI